MQETVKWIILLSISFLSQLVMGQENTSFRQLTKKDGLSQISVFSIAQDDAGFMWFGTRDGLNKFDGIQFKVYKKQDSPNSIVSNDIRTLNFDTIINALWIGTNSGLSLYQSATDDFTNFFYSPYDSTSISGNVVRQIYRDSKNRVWIGTSTGLSLLDEKSQTFQRFYFQKNIGSQDVRSIIEDRNGQLWFGTADGLFNMSENEEMDFVRVDTSAKWNAFDSNIKNILEDERGNFWIGTVEGGVSYWDRKNDSIKIFRTKKDDPNSLSHNNTRTMCFDPNGNLWVGTWEGLNLLKKGEDTFQRFDKAILGLSGLSDKSIHSLFIDRQGSLWVGTYYGGVNYLNEQYNRFNNFKYAPVGNALSGNVVSSFAEDDIGNLYIGTEGGGLNFYDKGSKQFSHFQFQAGETNSISGNNVKTLLLDGDQLWIGTFQTGLNVFNTKTGQFQQFKHFSENKNSIAHSNIYGLHKEGDLLWILTYGGGLDILNLKNKKFHHYTHQSDNGETISSDLTRVVLKTRTGQFWIGTERGLNKVHLNGAKLPESFEVFLANEKIYSLQEDYNGTIWVGTFTNGMYCFDPQKNTFEHFTVAEGLPGNTVFGILEGKEGILWLSTNNGLSKFDVKKKSFSNYNYSSGLENSEYNFNAYYKTRSGDLLFGGINGFTQFDPEFIQPNEFIPPVVFTELRKNNRIIAVGDDSNLLEKNINATNSLVFNYNEANFSIGFAALDYLSPENNHYKFMLEGIDQDWNTAVGSTGATYTIQREGKYTFRLKGGNSSGLFNPNERRLSIEVLPPPWRTWWAYLTYAIVLGALLFGLFRFIRLRHRLQLEQIEKKQQEALNEVKLRFFTNITHEFRTPLTLILGPLGDMLTSEKHSADVKNRLSLIHRNAQRLLNLVNQVLTFRKLHTDHEPLKVVHGNLVEFLEEIFLPFQETARMRNIQYEFDTSAPEIEAWFDQDKLEKVFFNLLSNAFKFTADGGHIALLITQNDTSIDIRVRDNGVGIEPEFQEQIFKRFYERSDTRQTMIKGTGIGLAISKQMVALHRGEIAVENNRDEIFHKGTTFTVRLPKGYTHFDEQVEIKQGSSKQPLQHYHPIIPDHSVIASPQIDEIQASSDQLSKLLIVEDNADVRTYIQQVFSDTYQIVIAENGEEGLKEAEKELPDLIISDVMMPKMDGITFCHQIKTTLETSHIPVILLTARTASLFKIEGLKTGADDYLTKPFNPEELRLRVRNTIKSRQEARDKFARVLNFDPKEISITSADEIFLEKALQVVEEQMENYSFNVNQFAFELAISRPLLFTKLKALTGQTPNNFIKTIRLKRAAQLVKTKKMNISEISHKVGFKDPKYFRQCFKKQFEMSPSEYAENSI